MEGGWRSVFTGKEERVRARKYKKKRANVQTEAGRRTEQEVTLRSTC